MKMQRIVVGLDGSTESRQALEWAADLAALNGAEITAVTVFDAMAWGMAPVYLPDFGQLRAELQKDLDSWCEPLRSRGLVYHAVMREGSPAVELLSAAEAEPADLIVVGSRGRGGFQELLLGSVAHHMIQHATHPVVVLPRPAAREAAATPATANGVTAA